MGVFSSIFLAHSPFQSLAFLPFYFIFFFFKIETEQPLRKFFYFPLFFPIFFRFQIDPKFAEGDTTQKTGFWNLYWIFLDLKFLKFILNIFKNIL